MSIRRKQRLFLIGIFVFGVFLMMFLNININTRALDEEIKEEETDYEKESYPTKILEEMAQQLEQQRKLNNEVKKIMIGHIYQGAITLTMTSQC